MSDEDVSKQPEIPSVPPARVQALLIAKMQAEFAHEHLARLCAEFERDVGARLDQVELSPDGRVTRKAGPG